MPKKVRHLVLIGMKSAGKTAAGQAISRLINWQFFDTDCVIEQLHRDKSGNVCGYKVIHKEMGNHYFRELERQAITELSNHNSPSVIATGGGSLQSDKNILLLKQSGCLVHLKASRAVLQQRWLANPPGFIDLNHIEDELKQYYSLRLPIYQRVADIEVVVDDKTVADIANSVIMSLELF